MKGFHISLNVACLRSSLHFYTCLLACKKIATHKDSIDVLFFGNQLTLRQQSYLSKDSYLNHMGPILRKDSWVFLSEYLERNSVPFVLDPIIFDSNSSSERGKFMIKDPDGILLEFKYYL